MLRKRTPLFSVLVDLLAPNAQSLGLNALTILAILFWIVSQEIFHVLLYSPCISMWIISLGPLG